MLGVCPYSVGFAPFPPLLPHYLQQWKPPVDSLLKLDKMWAAAGKAFCWNHPLLFLYKKIAIFHIKICISVCKREKVSDFWAGIYGCNIIICLCAGIIIHILNFFVLMRQQPNHRIESCWCWLCLPSPSQRVMFLFSIYISEVNLIEQFIK